MELNNNERKYKKNIFPPRELNVGDSKYTIYKASFNSLYDLYNYLKSDPEINSETFPVSYSINNPSNFAGKSYSEALEDLVKILDVNDETLLKLKKNLLTAKNISVDKYRTVKSIGGGRVNIHDYMVGAPICYEVDEKIEQPKFVKMHVSLGYACDTSFEQVLNRAIIIINIVNALERAGYKVDLNTYELCINEDELLYIVVKIKRFNEIMNKSSLSKVLCNVEFLRRILFRVLETLSVKNPAWGQNYGLVCDNDEIVKSVLKMEKDDIYIPQPNKLNIQGNNLYDDFVSAIHELNLESFFDIREIEREKELSLRRR